ncbi:MAG: hypothetical protein V8T62_03390 [Oscillospiraceae bacterium]
MGGIIYYGKYTKDQVERVNQIDLEELLRRNGKAPPVRQGEAVGERPQHHRAREPVVRPRR